MFTFLKRNFFVILGSFIIAAGWGWYHFSKHPKQLFVGKEIALWVLVFVGYKLGKLVFAKATKLAKRHSFWHTDFLRHLDELFFVVSLLFVIFFFKSELMSVAYVSLVAFVLFIRSNHYLALHPGKEKWVEVNKAIFGLAYFLFVVQAGFQYAAFHYYILDSNIRFFNIVLFRSVAMTLVWLFGFVVASYLYAKVSGVLRYVVVVAWSALFIFMVVVWCVNVGVLYYSGLYFNPIVVAEASGAGAVVAGSIVWYLGALAIVLCGLFLWFVRRTFKAHSSATALQWQWYRGVIGLTALVSFVGLTSLQNTPEHSMIVSFYKYYFAGARSATLDPVIFTKLEKFGLHYEPDQFYVNSRPLVYSPSSTAHFLPNSFKTKPPNVVVFFLESYSARLTNVYNNTFPDVTPHLVDFSKDPHTTVFNNYYNASTPTITGTLSQLCSFLPPTGHNEIQNDDKFQAHRLLCLPEVLKKHLGFKYANYITAVDKEFAHKDGIFTSAGIDEVLGTAELAKRIKGAPLSWGYSDHQMMPELFKEMQAAKAAGKEPFYMALATVDTHPPFNLAKDAVPYGNGSQPVLNMFHTTDDAFGKFWEQFKNSEFYNNTIIITVADHAIFPGAITTDLFPQIANQLTFYDQNTLLMYVPGGSLPKTVDTLSSGIDVTPTVLQILGVNIPNSFEGHSVFDDRTEYPNILGMHELGLYINQMLVSGKRKIDYNVPSEITCPTNYVASATPDLTECDYLQFYNWKRAMLEEGRFWKH